MKVTFKGVRKPFWFNDYVKNGESLEVGKKYTVKELTEYSSWTKVVLEETGDLSYNYSWFTTEPVVLLTETEYNSLLEDQKWLQALENAGVDNWEGCSYARELLEEEEED